MRSFGACALSVSLFVLSLFGATRASAVGIDFEEIPAVACTVTATPLTTQGFTFTTDAANFFACDGSRTDLPSNGTITLGSEFPTPTTMVRAAGGTFSLVSVDLGELFTSTPAGHRVRIDGNLSGGGVLTVIFVLDGINDGAGGLDDFETFALPGTFVDLTSVVLTGLHTGGDDSRFMFDNLVIPEPGTALLLCGGLLGLASLRRRA